MKIISFSHNDLDALGCELCIKEKFKDHEIQYFNTNYRNLEQKTKEILELEYDFLIISDICFNNNLNELLELAKRTNILYIDHHEYSEDFFNKLPNNIKVVYDKNHSAAYLTYDYLKCSDYLKHLCTIIESFDIWKHDSKYFELGFKMNMYFWSYYFDIGIQDMHNLFYPKLDPNFKIRVQELESKANNFLEQHKQFIRTNNGITFAIIDEYYMNLAEALFKDKDNIILIIITSYGKVMYRINESYPDDKARLIKITLLEDVKGHLKAFSVDLKFNNMQECSKFCNETYNKIKNIL